MPISAVVKTLRKSATAIISPQILPMPNADAAGKHHSVYAPVGAGDVTVAKERQRGIVRLPERHYRL